MNIEKLIKSFSDEVIASFPEFADDIIKDFRQFLNNNVQDITELYAEYENGDLDKEDFEFLLQQKKEGLVMIALEKKAKGRVRLAELQRDLMNLFVNKILDL